jgi:hypothetical protein
MGAGSLRQLSAAHGERVQFVVIYIREAHPRDGWTMGSHDIRDPRTLAERRKVAAACQASLDWGIPTCVDRMDDAVMKAYAAWPDRLYLVGADGRVKYAGGRGPWGFRPEELREAIEALGP